jgi:hypothetical protein
MKENVTMNGNDQELYAWIEEVVELAVLSPGVLRLAGRFKSKSIHTLSIIRCAQSDGAPAAV